MKIKYTEIEIKNFNYIHGPNGSGKTLMMKKIALICDSLLYNPNLDNELSKKMLLDLLSLVCNDRLMYYRNSLSKLDYTDDTLLLMACAMALQENEENSVLLFDPIYWDSYDNYVQSNIIKSLDAYPTQSS